LLVCLALAAALAPGAAPPDHRDRKIAELIERLGDDDFDVREDADRRLEGLGEPAIIPLYRATFSDDLEVRRRASRLHRRLSAKLHVFRYDGYAGNVLGVAFSPDGKQVVASSSDGTVRLLDARSGKLVRRLQHPYARSVAFLPSGKGVITTGDGGDQTVRLWDLETGREVKRIGTFESVVHGVAVSADGKRLLIGVSGHRTARLVQIETGKELRRFAHPDHLHGIALSADGKTSVTGSYDGLVRVWDNETGKEKKSLRGHEDQLHVVAISPDGKMAASSGKDRTVRLWDLEAGKEVRRMKGHTRWGHALAFSPDNRLLASGGYDGAVRLWDVRTGKELHRFDLPGTVADVAISADGRIAAVGSDRSVHVWRVPK
jgi:WD40 repeat protein